MKVFYDPTSVMHELWRPSERAKMGSHIKGRTDQ